MQTGVVAGADYILSDATTRNLDLLQRSSSFEANRWLAQMEDAVTSGMQQTNGFLLYGELAPLAQADMSSSPDAQGDEYQRALLLADQTFGQFIDWLGQQGLLQNTLIALTTSQAQANHTDADNFYGMGVTDQGTSKQTLLAVSGPARCKGTIDNNSYTSFVIAPVLMHALGLPAPASQILLSPAVFSSLPDCVSYRMRVGRSEASAAVRSAFEVVSYTIVTYYHSGQPGGSGWDNSEYGA